ncbi:pyruvate dehydrogenase complex dihydrolipoamide acetyltransferase [Salinibacter sp. 10B]|uniref:pyruvate dehydrogenase complex dihydrolipoamide acetyltransferase n=1 Tax=Salinibacter sp. 10B TaxID=1923971 RepID=UPI000CF411FE|nr:pyruvate dehydrogenase complex dihydrolipoamide acetyltransferase [Salinibacter sp. 10B]PQJ33395.1 pyruvate dehydrogenase complex dihydrolipoamide acetyltransferase [Salinibacter sp. 10B]
MAIPIEMPKLSDTMEEGVLSAWLVDEGEEVSSGDILAQVETDKATMDLEAFDEGILLKKMIEEGDAVPIGQLIAVIGEEGEDISDILSEHDDGTGAAEEPEPADESSDDAAAQTPDTDAVEEPVGDGQLSDRTPEPVPAGTDAEGRRIKASPLARRIADEHDVDLLQVDGSGPEGRIVRRDVEARIEERERAPEPAQTPQPAMETPSYDLPDDEALYESENISQMRKTIARRLAESKYSSPHFYLTVDIDVERAVELRSELNELAEQQDRAKISFNDLITKACALSLKNHPYVNASYLADEGEIRKHNHVHIGIAVAIDEGLITPVVRNADRKGLTEIARETRELAERARNRDLEPEEFEGATFTTSNLGMFGVEEFTAIINPPNSAILAIGEIRDTPVVEDGEVVPGKRMKVTLSCDHRVVDGALGAQFLDSVRSYLEEPMNLLL